MSRCLSSLRISARLLDGFTGTGRFVAAPGLDRAAEKLEDFDIFRLGGDIVTGPPSFRFRTAQSSGRRAAKLL